MEEGITFVITAYDSDSNKIDSMRFYVEEEPDIYENDDDTTEFMVSTLNEYKARE